MGVERAQRGCEDLAVKDTGERMKEGQRRRRRIQRPARTAARASGLRPVPAILTSRVASLAAIAPALLLLILAVALGCP